MTHTYTDDHRLLSGIELEEQAQALADREGLDFLPAYRRIQAERAFAAELRRNPHFGSKWDRPTHG